MHCTIYLFPSTSTQKLQNSIHSLMGLHTMIQVCLCSHNVTNYSLINFPLQFCLPHCIRNLFCHLEVISWQLSSPAASWGPWGTILCGTKLLATCCLLMRFPMDTSNSNYDHMQFCMEIARQHLPNLGRCDQCLARHPNVSSTSHAIC